MTKMNRRDYLIGLGATGIAMATSCVQRGEQSTNINMTPTPQDANRLTIAKSEKPNTWKNRWSKKFPDQYKPDQIVKLIFYGLSSFEPIKDGSNRWCEIGFHAMPANGHRHELSIYAYTDAGGPCTLVYTSKEPKEQIGTIALTAERPDNDFKEVFFFQPGDVENRKDLSNRNDFRWMIDFESDYLYGTYLGSHDNKLEKIPDGYRPKFTVKNGLFYTMRRTASQFEIKSDDGTYRSPVNRVADVLGANIYVEPKSEVVLSINEKPHRIKAPGEIYFIHTCTKNSNRCKFPHPQGSVKEERNDFYMHYKAIELEEKPELGLYLTQEGTNYEEIDVKCPHDIPPSSLTDKPQTEDKKVSDESPCSAAGYGNGI